MAPNNPALETKSLRQLLLTSVILICLCSCSFGDALGEPSFSFVNGLENIKEETEVYGLLRFGDRIATRDELQAAFKDLSGIIVSDDAGPVRFEIPEEIENAIVDWYRTSSENIERRRSSLRPALAFTDYRFLAGAVENAFGPAGVNESALSDLITMASQTAVAMRVLYQGQVVHDGDYPPVFAPS